ncbi:MAG: hypothetical protein ACRD1X_10480 [Vicinamibacteria bacterium]
MFGKTLSQYLDVQKMILGLIAAVGLARLGLSLAGLPNATAAWLSMNVVGWAGALYYGVAVHTSGFGSYKQILPLAFFQIVLQQAIAVLGILLAIAGLPNVYAAPEYSFGAQSQWVHALSHLTIGIVIPPFLLWGVASLVMLIAKKGGRRRAAA